MFTPQSVKAHDFLKGRKDPPASVFCWPGRSYVSCDGRIAVNTGPWVRDGGKSVGYFTTVWHRQGDGGWKWSIDQGDDLVKPRPLPEKPRVTIASCAPISEPVASVAEPR